MSPKMVRQESFLGREKFRLTSSPFWCKTFPPDINNITPQLLYLLQLSFKPWGSSITQKTLCYKGRMMTGGIHHTRCLPSSSPHCMCDLQTVRTHSAGGEKIPPCIVLPPQAHRMRPDCTHCITESMHSLVSG